MMKVRRAVRVSALTFGGPRSCESCCSSRGKSIPGPGQFPYESADTEGQGKGKIELSGFIYHSLFKFGSQALHHPSPPCDAHSLSPAVPSGGNSTCGSLVTDQSQTNQVPGTAGRENGFFSSPLAPDQTEALLW